ncbi:MAG: DUF4214 domain-containing protein [Actinomycetota bacterium]
MTRRLLHLGLATLIALSTWLVTPSPASATTYPSKCPVMTDSITRLYLAFFKRQPDPAGFRHWVQEYSTGGSSLAEIAQSFATADEFANRRYYDNQSYVDWLYDEVLGPTSSIEREDYWVEALDAGYPRGSVALAFTESWEYVAKTQTAMPLAGYLRWYPEGTHWYCDIGSVTRTVRPLTGEVWADYYFSNRGDHASGVELWTLEADGRRNVRMTSGMLQANYTDYNWDGHFNGDGSYGHSIDVRAGANTNWVVVFYPRTLGPDRLGWQIN